ncbi:MAG: hypothetical protein R2742_02245 [Micropruina glycogenica]
MCATLRVDFLSWFESGTDAGIGQVGVAHGREAYETALRWMDEAAGADMMLSLVMPHLHEDAKLELRCRDMVRINADADRGGWARLSGGRQSYQSVWPNWHNPFCGFTGWSHRAGQEQLILDGDFLMPSTFSTDEERKTMMNLMVIAGSPLTIGDTHATIDGHGWVFTNKELLELNAAGLSGSAPCSQRPPVLGRPRFARHRTLGWATAGRRLGGGPVQSWRYRDGHEEY